MSLGQSRPPIPEAVTALLERAAYHYNRLQAAVASGTPSLVKMTPRLTGAADEAMADVLHHAAVLTKFPEGGDTALELANGSVAALDELATRIEEIVRSQAPAEQAPSHLEGVLEDLRLEALAREELRAEDDPLRQRT